MVNLGAWHSSLKWNHPRDHDNVGDGRLLDRQKHFDRETRPLYPSPQQNNSNDGGNNSNRLPRTIEYGSMAYLPGQRDDEMADKTVTWEDEDENQDTRRAITALFDLNGIATTNQNVTTSAATTMSASSGSTEQLELPSLTAAFQSIENRPLILNCLWYLLIYFSISVIAYSYVFERWTIIDSLYFAVATFTTCGYSDLEPTTTAGKLFTIAFAIYGVMILGVFIAIFGSFISEAQTRAMRKFRRKKQHEMMQSLFQEHMEGSQRATPAKKTNGVKAEGDIESSGFWKDHVSLADDIWRVVKAEFPLIGLVAIMALILGMREGWGLASTLYFCIMAATTTGYGDYAPTNQADKLYCVIFLPLAVAVFGEVLGRIATVYIERKQRIAQYKFLHRSLTLCDIRNMDTDDDGKVDREEFLTYMLVALQKVDRDTIEELRSIFDSLDTNGNGLLEEEDLIELAEENYVPTLKRLSKEWKSVPSLTVVRGSTIDSPSNGSNSQPGKSKQQHRRAHTMI